MANVRQIRERQRRLGRPPTRRATKPSRPEDYAGGGAIRWAVARGIDEVNRRIKAHYLTNPSSPPQEGAWQAYGDEVEVELVAMPGQKVENYDVSGVITPLVGALEDENLGYQFVPLLVLPDGTAMIPSPMPRGMVPSSYNRQGSEGSGV